MKCYVGGAQYPNEYTFVDACFAENGKQAKQMLWKYGNLSDECEDDYMNCRVVRAPEHDYLFGKDDRTDSHLIRDDLMFREMGWMMDGDNHCDTCGKADYEGKWPVCEHCGQCAECGHDDDCESGDDDPAGKAGSDL